MGLVDPPRYAGLLECPACAAELVSRTAHDRVEPRSWIVAHAAFITSGVAIDIAARDTDLVPRFAVGCGCRTDSAAGRVTVFTHRRQSRRLLSALERFPVIAVTFGRPSDHRSLQLKGDEVRLEAIAAGDAARMHAYVEDFVADMALFGASRRLSEGYINLVVEETLAIASATRVRPDARPGRRLTS